MGVGGAGKSGGSGGSCHSGSAGGSSKACGAGSAGSKSGASKSCDSKASAKADHCVSAAKSTKVADHQCAGAAAKDKLNAQLDSAAKAKASAKASKGKYDARQLVNDPRVRAMLNTIGKAEGASYGTIVNGTVVSSKTNKSLVGKKNVTISDFSRHPETLVKVNSKGLKSTAAGKYQFLSKTWNEVSTRLGLKDFSPQSQDIAAVQKMIDRGMMDSILKGDIRTAINKGTKEWASLPNTAGVGSYKGQNARSLDGLDSFYHDNLRDNLNRDFPREFHF